jgi:hypothetical protein
LTSNEEIDNRQIPYIGRAALLQNKRAAERPKDLADVAWLEAHSERSDLVLDGRGADFET